MSKGMRGFERNNRKQKRRFPAYRQISDKEIQGDADKPVI